MIIDFTSFTTYDSIQNKKINTSNAVEHITHMNT